LNQIFNRIRNFFSSHDNRSKIFYAAAIAPFALLTYSYSAWPFGIAIPLYSFLLLALKKPKLFSHKEASHFQKAFGLLMIFASFLLYFVLVPIFPDAAFYGVGNYAVYILGLFLVFFDIHALREAFSPLFLIVATTSTSLISELVEPVLSPYAIHTMASLIVTLVRLLGIRTDVIFVGYPIITIHTPKGPVAAAFIWGCVGFASTLIFSIILVVVLSEESCRLRTKILWSAVGLVGVFFLNIARVVMIFVTDYFYGYEAGAQVHYFIGYAIFITWIGVFFYAFSRRQARTLKNQETKENPISPTGH
jgi:exosortase/archaeosortase family protein